MYINEYQVAFNLITMPYLILYLCREKSLIDEMKTTSICVYIEERREKREERREKIHNEIMLHMGLLPLKMLIELYSNTPSQDELYRSNIPIDGTRPSGR